MFYWNHLDLCSWTQLSLTELTALRVVPNVMPISLLALACKLTCIPFFSFFITVQGKTCLCRNWCHRLSICFSKTKRKRCVSPDSLWRFLNCALCYTCPKVLFLYLIAQPRQLGCTLQPDENAATVSDGIIGLDITSFCCVTPLFDTLLFWLELTLSRTAFSPFCSCGRRCIEWHVRLLALTTVDIEGTWLERNTAVKFGDRYLLVQIIPYSAVWRKSSNPLFFCYSGHWACNLFVFVLLWCVTTDRVLYLF